DGEYTDSGGFTLTVNPVNDAPVTFDIDVSIAEDSGIIIDLLAEDVDSSILTGSIVVQPLHGSVTLQEDGLSVFYQPFGNYHGTDYIEYKVFDDDLEFSNSSGISITITPVNDAPVITQAPTATTNEDIQVDIILEGSDVDGDDLTYLLDQDSEDGDVTINGSIATFIGNQDFNGITTFTYRVTDGELTSSSETVSITVTPVNDAPVLSAIDDQSIDEDNILTYELSAGDVDGDALNFIASVDGNASVDVTGSTLTITSDQDFNGSIAVSVSVSDGEYTDSGSFTLTVNPVNDAPVLVAIDDQNIDEDNILTYELSADDVDGDDLTYDASVDGNASVDVTGSTLTIT
ncbi:uncharacterized protein METZ01_LOCUS322897, partial [marine metagenome]